MGSASRICGEDALQEALAQLDKVARDLGRLPDYQLERAPCAARARAAGPSGPRLRRRPRRIAPTTAAPYVLLGQIRAQQGQGKAAREMFAKAAEVDPSSALAHLAMGRLNVADNDVDAALRDFDAAVKADPKSLAAARTKAVMLVQQGQTKEAIAFVETALKQDPSQSGLSHASRGTLRARCAMDKADDIYRKVLQTDARSVPARLGLARVALAQGKDEEAMTYLQSVVKDEPGHAHGRTSLYLARGQAWPIGPGGSRPRRRAEDRSRACCPQRDAE